MRVRSAIITGMLLAATEVGAQAPEPAAPAPAATETAPPAESAPPAADIADTAAESGVEATADAAGAGNEAMSEAELAELGFGGGEEAGLDTNLRVSGFIDLGMIIALNNNTKAQYGDPSFFIGNLNLYISKNLTETLRTMAEIRFLYQPNGAPGLGSGTAVNTSSADYADFNRSLRWGGMEIERVYLEWSPSRFLTLRGGQFLTPYGVWNVDHGSPTIIPAQKPNVIGIGFFPERQTGLEFYGKAEVSNNASIGYHLTLSNGTGPASEYLDMDKNKAVGARVYLDYLGFGELRLGGSAYYGRNTDSTSRLTYANDAFRAITKINTQSDVLALALDLVWKWRGVHLQGEFVSEQREYTKEGRTLAPNPFGGAPGFPADAFSWGAYGLLGYRFDWLGVMPFVMAQYFDTPILQTTGAHFGLNVRPIDALAIKAQYDLIHFAGVKTTVNAIYTQIAWAF